MSNENFKHHENRGKIYGWSRLYTQQCQCDIIMQVPDVGEFENHIFEPKFKKKLRSLNSTEKVIFLNKLLN